MNWHFFFETQSHNSQTCYIQQHIASSSSIPLSATITSLMRVAHTAEFSLIKGTTPKLRRAINHAARSQSPTESLGCQTGAQKRRLQPQRSETNTIRQTWNRNERKTLAKKHSPFRLLRSFLVPIRSLLLFSENLRHSFCPLFVQIISSSFISLSPHQLYFAQKCKWPICDGKRYIRH